MAMDLKEIETLAVEHESFGFGKIETDGLTVHGFDPEGLLAFVTALAQKYETIGRDRARLEYLGTAQPDAERYRKLVSLGKCNDKNTGVVLGGNSLKAEAHFRFWCSEDRLNELVDRL
jgi:hypothetical protein